MIMKSNVKKWISIALAILLFGLPCIARASAPVSSTACPFSKSGDVNGDEVLNAEDVVLCKKFIIDGGELPDECFNKADLNQDGKLDILDLILLKNAIVAIETDPSVPGHFEPEI